MMTFRENLKHQSWYCRTQHCNTGTFTHWSSYNTLAWVGNFLWHDTHDFGGHCIRLLIVPRCCDNRELILNKERPNTHTRARTRPTRTLNTAQRQQDIASHRYHIADIKQWCDFTQKLCMKNISGRRKEFGAVIGNSLHWSVNRSITITMINTIHQQSSIYTWVLSVQNDEPAHSTAIKDDTSYTEKRQDTTNYLT